MAAPARVKAGPSTPARKYWLDVDTGTEAVPIWTPVAAVGDFKPLNLPQIADASDFDSDFGADEAVDHKWGVEFKLRRKVQADSFTAYDPGQEALRTAGNATLASNRVQIRYYEMVTGGPRVEAYQGWVTVEWGEDGGDRGAWCVVSVKLYGQSDRTAITHPDTQTPIPTVASITPDTAAAAGGEAAYIKGQYFTGASDVEIDTTDVEDFQVIDDFTIAIVTPAMAAGTYTVHVTNGAGENTTGPSITYS